MIKIARFIKKLFKEYPSKMTLTAGLMVLAGLFEGLGISLFVPLLQLIQNDSAASQGRMQILIGNLFSTFGIPLTLGTLLLFTLTVFFLQYSIWLTQQYQVYKFAFYFQRRLREKLYEALMASKWQLFVSKKIGNLVNALVSEPMRANDAFHSIHQIISIIIISIIYIILAIAISWQMTLLILVAGVFLSLFLYRRLNKAHKIGQMVTDSNNLLQMEAIESLSGVKLIKGSNLEKNALERFQKISKVVENNLFISTFNITWIRMFFEFSMICLLIFILYVSVQYLRMTISSLVVLLFIFFRLSPRLTNIQNNQHLALVSLPAIEEIEKISYEAKKMKEHSGDIIFDKFSNSIKLENVDFYYQEDKPVVSNLSIDILKGKVVAIVGRSGSGKSTLVDLIMGLISPSKGKVLIDGVPLSDYGLGGYRSKIGYVPQDVFLFHDTILSNILWASKSSSDDNAIEAAKQANAHEFIESLPDGYHTVIGDRGICLSGGQRQRIALARALIRKPEILILDEATSSLDSESEQEIQKAIDSLSDFVTIIIVTHKLFSVKKADIIYVLDNGQLIESGTWNELISKKSSRFQRMQELQLI